MTLLIDIVNTPLYLVIALVVLATLLIVLCGIVLFLLVRVRALTNGEHGISFIDHIHKIHAEYGAFKSFQSDLQTQLAHVEKRLKRSVQGVATVRFNAFDGGGKQSSATALIAEDGTGVVISTLHARDRVSVFAKPLTDFVSTHELTKEEVEAIAAARIVCSEKK